MRPIPSSRPGAFTPGWWLYRFWWAWLSSFPWIRLVAAVPFIACLFLFGLVFARRGDDVRRQQFLQTQLSRAMSSEDFDRARLVLRRQLQMNPTNPVARLQMGSVLEEMGRKEEAVRWMRALAFPDTETAPPPVEEEAVDQAAGADVPADSQTEPASLTTTQQLAVKDPRRGDERAARWLITKHYYPQIEERKTLGKEEQAEFMELLRWLTEENPDDEEIAALYVSQLLALGRRAEALPILVSLIPKAPGVGLQAAVVARDLGNRTQAIGYARHSLVEFQKLLKSKPDDPELSVAAAQCHVFLEQHSEAVLLLQQAFLKCENPDHKVELQKVISRSLVSWASEMTLKPSKTLDDRLRILQILQGALQMTPNDPFVLQMVSDQILESLGENDPKYAALRESLIQGTSPGVSHFIRGTALMLKGDENGAQTHLELAAEQLPNSHVILNNLACVIAKRQDGDFERALKLSQAAIEKSPIFNPYFIDTRGQILCKLGRFKEAIPDLEKAILVPELAQDAHLALAECYQKLGLDDLGKQHSEAAKNSPPPKR
jgi:tetratricopeptide (TPR) repeat protein